MTTKRSDDLNYLWWLAFAGITLFLLYQLAPILAPFLFAAILAYICDPLVDKMENRKIPRTVGVLLTMIFLMVLFVSLFLIMLPLFEKETQLLVERLPGYIDWFRTQVAPWLKARFGVELQLDSSAMQTALAAHWQSAGGLAAKVLPSLGSSGMALAGLLANALLVPVVFFYLLRDWDVMVAHVDEMIPRRWHVQVSALARESDQVLGEFLRGQISVMLLMSVFYSLALWIAGLEYSLPIGIIAGLLVFVPYLGMVLGLTLATLAGAMQFQGLGGLVPVWIAFGVGQLLEGMVVTPWLVGERIGLHPLAVIFALMAFGQLFGFFGILLALPASAVLLVGLRQVRRKYMDSTSYQG